MRGSSLLLTGLDKALRRRNIQVLLLLGEALTGLQCWLRCLNP